MANRHLTTDSLNFFCAKPRSRNIGEDGPGNAAVHTRTTFTALPHLRTLVHTFDPTILNDNVRTFQTLPDAISADTASSVDDEDDK
jgi:hypothetical protein